MYIDYRYIDGYDEDYIISNYGDVISLKRKKPRLLKANLTKRYKKLDLCKNGKIKTWDVHALVGNAFIGKRINGLTFDHIDRVKTNNRADNLRLATKSEQTINQDMRITNTSGETNIVIINMRQYRYYRVQIVRNGKKIVEKMFNVETHSINDAVIFRDAQLRMLSEKSEKA